MNQETRSRCFRFSSPRSAGTDQRLDCREFANSALNAWQVPLFLFSLPEAGLVGLLLRHLHNHCPTTARSPAAAWSLSLFRRGASAEHLLNRHCVHWRTFCRAKRESKKCDNSNVRLKQLLDFFLSIFSFQIFSSSQIFIILIFHEFDISFILLRKHLKFLCHSFNSCWTQKSWSIFTHNS